MGLKAQVIENSTTRPNINTMHGETGNKAYLERVHRDGGENI